MWLLNSLADIVKNYWNKLSEEDHAKFINYTEGLAKELGSLILGKPPLDVKYSNLFLHLLRQSYPKQWKDAFTNLINLASESEQYVKLIVQTLEFFNDEVVMRDVSQTPEDLAISN